MANTLLTPSADPSTPVYAPTPGDPVRAGAVSIVGTIRIVAQQLYNKIYCLFTGRVYIGSVYVTATSGDIGTLPGTPLNDGEIYAPKVLADEVECNSATVANIATMGRAVVDDGDVATLYGDRLAFDSSGPTKTTAIENEVTPLNVVKAWALAHTAPSSTVDGANIGLITASLVGADTHVQVTLASNFASANAYSVSAFARNTTTHVIVQPSGFIRTSASQFTLVWLALDMTAANYEVDIIVCGRQ